MDTPRSNVGDATYLGHQPDFDMTPEPSFHSPSKDNNLMHQLRNGRSINLRTPRGSRAPFGDRRNLPAGIGSSEFTPMLKSATRNSARRRGKENSNGISTPGLRKIEEDMDMTNVPVETSLFGPSRNMSYVDASQLPEVDASSTTSTPLLMPTRRGGNDKGPLQDGNQLSLREQENVIDKIEKENFGLKLKIHFLEEALGKAGPGFSEAALKENTELKVDKVTMQRELSKYKKHLASAEKDLETYQQQILEVQEKAKKKYADQNQKADNDVLRQRLKDSELKVEELEHDLQRKLQDVAETGQLRDEIGDLEADLREKDRELTERDDELDNLNAKLQEMEDNLKIAEDRVADYEQLQKRPDPNTGRVAEMQEKINDLEADLRVMDQTANERENEIEDLRTELKTMEEGRNLAEQRMAEFKQHQSRADANAGTIIDLQDKIHNLESLVTAMERTVNDRENEISNLKTGLKTAEQRIADSKQHQSRADANAGTINELQDKINDLEADLREMDRATNERDNEIHDLKADLTTAEQRIADFKQHQSRADANAGTINELQVKINELEVDLRDMDRTANERENEIHDLRTDLKTAEQRIADFKQQHQSRGDASAGTIRELQVKVHELEAELRDMDRTANDREIEIEDLRSGLMKTEESRKAAERRASDLEHLRSQSVINADVINELQEKIRGLEADLRAKDLDAEEREDEMDELNNKLAEIEERCQAAEDKAADFREQHQVQADTNTGKIGEMHEKIHSLEVELRAKNREAHKHEKEAADLMKNLKKMEENQKTAEQKITEFEQLRSRPDEKAGIISELQQKIRSLETGLLAKDREADEREDELDQLNTQLAATEERCQVAEEKLSESKRQQSRTDATADKISELQETIRELHENIKGLEEDAHARDLDADEREDLIDELQRTLADTEAKCQAAEDEIIDIKQQQQSHADANADKIEELQEKIRELEADLATTKKSWQSAEEKVSTDFKQQKSRADATAAEVVTLQEKVESLEDEIEVLQTMLEESEETVAGLRGVDKLCKELRQKLDRTRSERATYKASAEKLQYDCDRLKKGAEDALAWIQAKNAEKSAPPPATTTTITTTTGGPIKRATMATFRYGDVVMDVVDQKDHEAVIRAADSAQRRHEKEIRGMVLQAEWLQARWEREARLRRDGGFAKKYLQLRVDIADACNKADLRILNRIHQDLGLKSPEQLLAKRPATRKPVSKLRVFLALVRAVARMRVEARKWAVHEKTRVQLAEAWREKLLLH